MNTVDTHGTTVIHATVSPLLFVSRPEAMVALLGRIGLRPWIRQAEWTLLRGTSGRVGVHPQSRPDDGAAITSLNLDVPELSTAVDALADAGLEARWWDESFGRLGSLVTPFGEVSLSSELGDAYGHEVSSEANRGPVVEVLAVVDAPDVPLAARSLAALGFVPDGVGVGVASGWTVLRSRSGGGAVALRTGSPRVDANGFTTAELALVTEEALPALVERLHADGIEADAAEGLPDSISVTGPGGIRIEIAAR